MKYIVIGKHLNFFSTRGELEFVDMADELGNHVYAVYKIVFYFYDDYFILTYLLPHTGYSKDIAACTYGCHILSILIIFYF